MSSPHQPPELVGVNATGGRPYPVDVHALILGVAGPVGGIVADVLPDSPPFTVIADYAVIVGNTIDQGSCCECDLSWETSSDKSALALACWPVR